MRAAMLVTILMLSARTASAETSTDPDLTPPRGQVEGSVHFGVASAPFDVSALPEASGQAFVLVAKGRYQLVDALSLELCAPLALGSVRQPAGSYVDAEALGNPQLAARYSLLERPRSEARVALSGGAAVGAPLASHAQDLMPNRLLAIADGIEGRGRPEWFTPGVLSLTPFAELSWTTAAWGLYADLRLPLLVRVSEADLPSATSKPRGLGFAGIIAAEARRRVSRRLSLAVAAHLFVDVTPAVAHERGVSRLQDFERLSLYLHFGSRAVLGIDLQAAIAGELGGSTVAGGFHMVMNLE